ncbi:MAG TPA: hypothetical protein VKB79_04250 [Bryobacteraceae bacterium]|nr:hypothetical protein [Bryobacteraceae bacterium]
MHTAFAQVNINPGHRTGSYEYIDRIKEMLGHEMPEHRFESQDVSPVASATYACAEATSCHTPVEGSHVRPHDARVSAVRAL